MRIFAVLVTIIVGVALSLNSLTKVLCLMQLKRLRELCVRLSALRLFYVGHVVHFRLLSARMVFYVEVKKERFTAEGSR